MIFPSGLIRTEIRGVLLSPGPQTPYFLETTSSVSLAKSNGKSYLFLNFRFSSFGSALIPKIATLLFW